MAKGRHRKAELTVLPAGSRVQTGKSRTAAKTRTYVQPLPVQLSCAAEQTDAASTSWTQRLWSLIGWREKKPTRRTWNERPNVVRGRYDPMTRAVYVEVTSTIATKDGALSPSSDQTAAMRLLWECGFFGKGTLSRSEPSWRTRQVQTRQIQRRRAQGSRVYTPEELTALRRKERRAAKIERARLAVRAGQQLADGIVALGGELNEEDEKAIAREVQQDLAAQASGTAKEGGEEQDESAYGKHIPGLVYLKPKKPMTKAVEVEEVDIEEEDFVDVEEMETLQLSPQETLFLAGMLTVLEVEDEEGQLLPLDHLYALLLSACLPASAASFPQNPLTTPPMDVLQPCARDWARPDNPFLLQYVAYHHFRSLGWVVRSGIKFCVDWLLYKRGPAFSHAEFAVVVLPIYEDARDEASSPFGPHPMAAPRDWVWFSSVNRVNTQVLKTLILCYVIIPPLGRVPADVLATPQAFVDGLRGGQSYRVREYSIRRFTPQRMRA